MQRAPSSNCFFPFSDRSPPHQRIHQSLSRAPDPKRSSKWATTAPSTNAQRARPRSGRTSSARWETWPPPTRYGSLPPGPAERELPRGLAALVGNGGDGAPDAVGDLEGEFDDDRFLEEYRLKRLAELREKEEKAGSLGKRGVIATISKEEYVSKVTRASAGVDPDDTAGFVPATNSGDEEDDEDNPSLAGGPKPTGPARWIVCHMFREGVTSCDDNLFSSMQ